MSILLERLNDSSSNSSPHPHKIQIPQPQDRKKPFLAQQETGNLLSTNQPNDKIAF